VLCVHQEGHKVLCSFMSQVNPNHPNPVFDDLHRLIIDSGLMMLQDPYGSESFLACLQVGNAEQKLKSMTCFINFVPTIITKQLGSSVLIQALSLGFDHLPLVIFSLPSVAQYCQTKHAAPVIRTCLTSSKCVLMLMKLLLELQDPVVLPETVDPMIKEKLRLLKEHEHAEQVIKACRKFESKSYDPDEFAIKQLFESCFALDPRKLD